MVFWDLGGQRDLHSIWDKYYSEAHGVIYVIDSSDEERLRESLEAFGAASSEFPNAMVASCPRRWPLRRHVLIF